LGTSIYVDYEYENNITLHCDFVVAKNSKVSYDISFNNGVLDSIYYSYDTCRFKMLHVLDSSREYQAISGDKWPFPDPKHVGPYPLVHCSACRNDHYQFLFEFDSLAAAIMRITQNYHDPKIVGYYRFEGILVTFKKGKSVYLTIVDSKGLSRIFMYFRKSGRLKKIIVLDETKSDGHFELYRKLKYARQKFR
jgi:hypothetical protein